MCYNVGINNTVNHSENAKQKESKSIYLHDPKKAEEEESSRAGDNRCAELIRITAISFSENALLAATAIGMGLNKESLIVVYKDYAFCVPGFVIDAADAGILLDVVALDATFSRSSRFSNVIYK